MFSLFNMVEWFGQIPGKIQNSRLPQYQLLSAIRGRGPTVDDTLANFSEVIGMQTYSDLQTNTPITAPAVWRGYNAEWLSTMRATPNGHGAIGESIFAQAGDTNNGAGGYGLEHSMGCFRSPDGNHGTNAIEVRAVDDNTNTVTVNIVCGSGQSGTGLDTVESGIAFSDAGGTVYMEMGPQATGGQLWVLPIMEAGGGIIVGFVPLALTATGGFFRFPTCAGTPTGVPTAGWGSGSAVWDTVGNHLWIWTGATWVAH